MRNMAFLIGIILMMMLAFNSCMGKRSPDAWKTKDNSIMADIMMRDFVKKQLKSPSTAKFASAAEKNGRFVQKGDDNVYFVKSFVDSQNSFGATIRTHYYGEIKQVSDDKWQLITLEFDE